MGCLICRNLERAYEAGLSEYIEARSSAYYPVCTKPAASKKVDLERARYELEEHRLQCVSAAGLHALSRARDVSTTLRHMAVWRKPDRLPTASVSAGDLSHS
jgi:hypothetical protein